MFKVRYKVRNATESWSTYGSYGDERSALHVAVRIAPSKLMVQVVDPSGLVIWSH